MADRRELAIRLLGAAAVLVGVIEVGLLWGFISQITPDRLLAVLIGGSAYLALIRVRWLLEDRGD